MLKLILTLVIGLALCADAIYIEGEEYDDWQELHFKIFGNETLTPEETYEYLIKLRDLYTGRTDDGSVFRLEKMNALLKAAEVSDSGCDNFDKMSFHGVLRQQFRNYELNAVPYIKHHFRRQLELCKSYIESQVEAGKKALKPGTYERLQRMANSISEELRSEYMTQHANKELEARLVLAIEDYIRKEKKIAYPKSWPLKGIFNLDNNANFEEFVYNPVEEVFDNFINVLYLGLYDDDVLGPFQEIGGIMRKLFAVDMLIASTEKS